MSPVADGVDEIRLLSIAYCISSADALMMYAARLPASGGPSLTMK